MFNLRFTSKSCAVVFGACSLLGTVMYARDQRTLASPRRVISAPDTGHILVFGGEDHRVYLGCFSCNEREAESVFNQSGKFGSNISPTSVANRISQFGDRKSPYSACNGDASRPPILVDEDGTYYGELTVNVSRPARVTAPAVVAWLTAFCGPND